MTYTCQADMWPGFTWGLDSPVLMLPCAAGRELPGEVAGPAVREPRMDRDARTAGALVLAVVVVTGWLSLFLMGQWPHWRKRR